MALFALKTSDAELKEADEGVSREAYEQHAPVRTIVGDAFPNGSIHFRWQVAGQKWWVPARTYIRTRLSITKGNGAPLNAVDDAAPAMGLASHLYQNGECRINDKVVSRISDFMPQIDALHNRVGKSRAWLEGIGQAMNQWSSSFAVRQGVLTGSNGLAGAGADAYSAGVARLEMGFAAADTIAVAAASGVLTVAGAAPPDLRTLLKAGDEIEIDGGGNIGTLRYRVSHVINATTAQLNNEVRVDFPAVNAAFRRYSLLPRDEVKQVGTLEDIWQPPMSIFKIDHALPSGKYELVLNPQTASVYQARVIESLVAAKVAGANADNIKVDIRDMYLYVATVDGPRFDDGTFLLDLDELRCQSDDASVGAGIQQKNFDVSPSTYALTCAFQDNRAGASTLYPPSKFNIGARVREELRLNRFFLQYAGLSKPSPDADPTFTAAAALTPGVDTTVQRYVESMLESGGYDESGSPETLAEYHDRGAYYHFKWARDGNDRSTRVQANFQFNPILTNAGRVLLFDHYKRVAMVEVKDGRVVDVRVEDQ